MHSGSRACQRTGVKVCDRRQRVQNAASKRILSAEVCGNDVDEDCDGNIDDVDEFPNLGTACLSPAQGICQTQGTLICDNGDIRCDACCWGTTESAMV